MPPSAPAPIEPSPAISSLNAPAEPAPAFAARRSDGFEAIAATVAGRYASCSRYSRHYVRWKLRLDPVHRAVLRLAGEDPLGRVVDLGCGRGQLGLCLLLAGCADSLTGIDWDERLLAEAAAASGPPAAWIKADLTGAAVPPADTILLIDLLYQLPPQQQFGLLDRAAAAAGRRLILRTFDPARGWRSVIGRLAERGIDWAGLYRRHGVSPLDPRRLVRHLEAAGFACTTAPAWGLMPLPNVMIVARRAGLRIAA